MAEIQKTEQTFRTETQSHIIERVFNHNVLLTTEGQRDRLSHLFFPFLLYLALNHWTCLPRHTISFMQTPKHAPNNSGRGWWVENPQIWANLFLILKLAGFGPWFQSSDSFKGRLLYWGLWLLYSLQSYTTTTYLQYFHFWFSGKVSEDKL